MTFGLFFFLALPFASLEALQPNHLRFVALDRFEMTANPGSMYQLQQSPTLNPAPSWQNIGAPLSVQAQGPLSWTIAATNSQSFFRVEIRSAAGGLSQTEAEALVTTQVIRPSEQTNVILGLRWPAILPAGAIIEPLSNLDENPKRWTNSAPSYLFVLDHAPSEKLAHPFTYILVETTTGALRVIRAFYPPVVDGTSRLTSFADRWKSEARFYPTNFTGFPPPTSLGLDIPDLGTTNAAPGADSFQLTAFAAGTNNTSTAHSTVNCTNVVRKKIAVVIASGSDDAIQNDAREMSALLTRLGFQVTDFNSSSNNVTQVYNGIKQAGQALGPCDKFFVYISSHTVLVDENDDNKPDDTPARLDYGLGHSNANKWLWLPNRANTFASALQAVPAGQLNLMLDTCYAEAFAVNMRRFRGVIPTGATWNIFASSSRTNTSGGSSTWDELLDYNNDDVNSVYTSKILDKVIAAADANQIDTDGDGQLSIEEIEAAFNAAHIATANELANGQQPKFDQLTGPVPVAVGDTFTVPPGQAITNKTALNDTTVPGAQFVLVTPPALHADLFSWNPATGEMTLSGLNTISQVTFTYKIVSGPFETDPVTVTIHFNARMNYAEEFLQSPDDPDKVRVPCLILDGLHYPIYQFRLANNPADACPNPHWHASREVFQLDVLSGPGRTDPNPATCGFGTVTEVQSGFLDVPKDIWQDFLIDHIPPIQ